MAEIIGNAIIKLMIVDSTNNYATAHLSKDNWSEGTVVFANEQISGRGQMNNSWESEPGKNLLLSVVLFPEFLPVQYQFRLSKIIAISCWEVLSLMVENVTVKWPNDIYVGNRKIAGILIENAIMGNTLYSTIAGIGLNVNQCVFKSKAPNPVSLCQLLNKEFDLEVLMLEILEALDGWYLKLKNGNWEEIDQFYLSHLYRRNEVAKYKDASGIYSGILKGVNEIGQLLIQPVGGELKCYHFKEVEFL